MTETDCPECGGMIERIEALGVKVRPTLYEHGFHDRILCPECGQMWIILDR
jgi:uncharacterized protein with PIN domain